MKLLVLGRASGQRGGSTGVDLPGRQEGDARQPTLFLCIIIYAPVFTGQGGWGGKQQVKG